MNIIGDWRTLDVQRMFTRTKLHMKRNIDVVLFLLSAFGLWFSVFPNSSHSVQIVKSHSVSSIFEAPSNVAEVFYPAESNFYPNNVKQDSLWATFLYANWDAESREAKKTVELLQDLISFTIFALNCDVPSTCMHKIKNFPQMQIHTPKLSRFLYIKSFDIRHLLKIFSLLTHPVKLIKNKQDLMYMLLNYDIVVLGSFIFSNNGTPRDFNVFNDAAISVNTRTRIARISQNIAFSIVLSSDKQFLFDLSLDDKFIVLYSSCKYTVRNHSISIRKSNADNILDQISDTLSSNLTGTASTCYLPVDITPQKNHVSELWNLILNESPLFLLIGPNLSLLESSDPALYMLKTLKFIYSTHSLCLPSLLAKLDPTINGSRSSVKRVHQVLRHAAVTRAKRHCNLASVCPIWWEFISDFINSSSSEVCGQNGSRIELGTVPIKSRTTSNEFKNVTLNSTTSKILALLENETTANKIINRATTLLYKISLYDERNQVNPDLLQTYQGVDAKSIVSQLNFLCCHWYHIERLVNLHGQSEKECDLNSLLYNITDNDVENSSIYGLGCLLNRTLEFHTLDSELQSTLAWEIGGYNSDDYILQSNKLGAAIIDKQNENIYRLEGIVNFASLNQFISDFHASKLKPWLRYPKPRSNQVFTNSKLHFEQNSNLLKEHSNQKMLSNIVINVKSDKHLNKLIHSSSNEVNWTQSKNLILLYYSSNCIYSYGGNSALWQFTAAAEHFTINSSIDFAKVDVFRVDLPWHLRVEHIPSIIYFPANRSSYSSVFPPEAFSSTNLYTHIVAFVYEHLYGKKKYPDYINSDLLASRMRSNVLHLITNHNSNQFLVNGLNNLHNICVSQSISLTRTLCSHAIHNGLRSESHQLQKTRLILTKLMIWLENRLNNMNPVLLAKSSNLYASLKYRKLDFNRLFSFYSKLWNTVQNYDVSLNEKFKILTSYKNKI